MLQIQWWAAVLGTNFTDINFVETDLHFFSCSSIEYWFRCMDLDGDGVLSMYELEYFYSEQVSKMEVLGIETMVFEDCLCQVWDFSCKGQFMYGCAEMPHRSVLGILSCVCHPVQYWVTIQNCSYKGDQAVFNRVAFSRFSVSGDDRKRGPGTSGIW